MRGTIGYASYIGFLLTIVVVAGAAFVALPHLVTIPPGYLTIEHPGLPSAALGVIGLFAWAMLSITFPKRSRARRSPVK